MNSSEIRQTFLDFFVEHDHLLIGHAPLRSQDDPTLLYINAGMAPLKRYFTGESRPPAPDLCNVQPCIRTTDIGDVGDRHHLTFFEMLGSWSINHYYKERAIELAFELLVERFDFPKDRLYATVFAGNPELGLAPDEVSAGVWESVGLRRDQIVALGMDNFWGPAGESGPCGPCTEVFFDMGEGFGEAYQPGGEFDTSRYIEIWNAGVFMELLKQSDGRYTKLPFTSVDTGSGLERMAMVLGGYSSVYETDLLQPIAQRIVELAGGQEAFSESTVRLLTDHLRTSTMILAEGVHPSNLGQGYIPRRLIRKSVEAVTRAGRREFPFSQVIETVIERFSPTYPHLAANAEQIKSLFEKERSEFGRVIDRGLEQLEAMRKQGELAVSGKRAFSLFATYGMPVELVQDYVSAYGGSLDRAGFEREFREHQERSKAPAGSVDQTQREWPTVLERVENLASELGVTHFVGYEQRIAEGQVQLLLVDGQPVESAAAGQLVEVVLDITPFYPEGGGQVGDRGQLRTEEGLAVEILDTRRTSSRVIVHQGEVKSGTIHRGEKIQAEVDREHRQQTAANHSATHLLQAALRQVLGTHVRQAGSLVEPKRLRFDFTHPSPVTPDELADIESLVNREILHDQSADIRTMPYQQAMDEGTLTLPGENYGDQVRRVRFGEFSAELCGGIHVPHTAAIGLFRIVQESGVAAGVRRIVAITREAALQRTAERERILAQLATRLSTRVEELPTRIDSLLAAKARSVQHPTAPVEAVEVQKTADDIPYVASWHRGEADELRQAAAQIAGQHQAIVALAAAEGNKVRVVVLVPQRWRSHYSANQLLKELLTDIGGSGGGNPGLAMGGGHNPAAAEGMLKRFGTLLAEMTQPSPV